MKNQLAEGKGILYHECGVLIHFHHVFSTAGLKGGLREQSKCQVKDRELLTTQKNRLLRYCHLDLKEEKKKHYLITGRKNSKTFQMPKESK